MICFTVIFGVLLFIIWITGRLLRRKSVEPPEPSSSLDKVGGTVLGLLEGLLLVSIISMDINFYPAPKNARSPLEDAVSYKVIKHIAPSIRDFTIMPFSALKNPPDKSETDDL